MVEAGLQAGPLNMDATLDWLQKTSLAVTIRDSLLLFPLLEAAHVIGLALVVGTIVIIDLRLLGVATMHRTFQRLADDTLKWTLAAFALTAITGVLMFTTNAAVYFHNTWFRAKAVLLVLAAINAIGFELIARRRMDGADFAHATPALAKVIGTASLLIWISVIVAGRMIGFTATRAQVAPPTPVEEPNLEELLGLPK